MKKLRVGVDIVHWQGVVFDDDVRFKTNSEVLRQIETRFVRENHPIGQWDITGAVSHGDR